MSLLQCPTRNLTHDIGFKRESFCVELFPATTFVKLKRECLSVFIHEIVAIGEIILLGQHMHDASTWGDALPWHTFSEVHFGAPRVFVISETSQRSGSNS